MTESTAAALALWWCIVSRVEQSVKQLVLVVTVGVVVGCVVRSGQTLTDSFARSKWPCTSA